MTQEKQPTPGDGRKTAADELPLILSMDVQRGTASLKVCCEPADAASYGRYVRFAYEAQPIKGQMSLQEVEARFNAVAWSSIWKRDTAYRAWLRGQGRAGGE